MKAEVLWRGLAVLLSLLLLAYLWKGLHVGDALSSEWMDRWVRGQGLSGELLYLALGAIAIAVGIPRQVIAFLGGYGFGLTLGTGLGVLAATLGAALVFYYARLLGRAPIATRFPRHIQRLDDLVRIAPFGKILLIRLLPVGHNLLTSAFAGVSRAPFGAFIAASALGYVPQTLIFALAGSGVTLDPGARIGASALLLLLSSWLSLRWYARVRARDGQAAIFDFDDAQTAAR